MTPLLAEFSAIVRPRPPVSVLSVSVPLPLAWMEYVPPVNCTVFSVPPSLTSSIPAVMLPFPSATKLPTLERNAPTLTLASVPLIENAYVPLRLAFEKFPAGGGGGVVTDEPLPPQETASKASDATAGKISAFIARPLRRRI